jgi:nucleoside-diphosphate-sugar epimerase
MLAHAVPSPDPPRRLVILGADGFLGRAVSRQSSAAGTPTLAVSRRVLDLAMPEAGFRLAALIQREDAVLILAAITPDRGRTQAAFDANIRIGEAIAAAFAAVTPAHAIYVSSDAVYPFINAPITERTPAAPADLYGAMHLTREKMLAALTALPLAVLRSAMLYGADDTHNAYGPNRFRRQAEQEGRIVLFGEGEDRRDHVAVEDAARLVWQVVARRSRGLLNLASGHSVSQAELARRVAACFATQIRIEHAPRAVPVSHRQFDISAIGQAFPDFAFTPLDEGLARAVREA